jgi:hypothetical protein
MLSNPIQAVGKAILSFFVVVIGLSFVPIINFVGDGGPIPYSPVHSFLFIISQLFKIETVGFVILFLLPGWLFWFYYGFNKLIKITDWWNKVVIFVLFLFMSTVLSIISLPFLSIS